MRAERATIGDFSDFVVATHDFIMHDFVVMTREGTMHRTIDDILTEMERVRQAVTAASALADWPASREGITRLLALDDELETAVRRAA